MSPCFWAHFAAPRRVRRLGASYLRRPRLALSQPGRTALPYIRTYRGGEHFLNIGVKENEVRRRRVRFQPPRSEPGNYLSGGRAPVGTLSRCRRNLHPDVPAGKGPWGPWQSAWTNISTSAASREDFGKPVPSSEDNARGTPALFHVLAQLW
ncbi:hypothetical protein BD309DRAFT_315235 [Dichomitus squalens]|nr:hypothetical protein BD309DRAFT_315235 [Dichomitus squalens]